jgi:hypothetical protein
VGPFLTAGTPGILADERGTYRLADQATTTPETRPLVPYLKLGATRDDDYLFGSKCKNCGATYLGDRESCGKCSTQGPFEEVRLSRDGKIHVWSIVHQAPPYAKTPYTAAVVDLADGVAVNTNIDVEPKPENLAFGMPVRMTTSKVSEDREGNAYVGYTFKPA